MSRQAIVLLDEGSLTAGVVENIIEMTADGAVGFVLPLEKMMWDCGQYPVAIGDRWEDGVWSRNGGPLTPVPTTEQRVDALEQVVATPIPNDLVGYKACRIAESKAALAEYLDDHPLPYTDGNRYSVTAEKQNLLTSALARHQIALAAGLNPALKWNATGQEGTEWTYNDLVALELAIAAYVEPLVAQQQALEVQINSCTTVEAVKGVMIAYAA